jgi:hypothetical protein
MKDRMIAFSRLQSQAPILQKQFHSNIFGYVVIDNFLEDESARALLTEIPDPRAAGLAQSRDYVFAKNKFEKSAIEELGIAFRTLRDELLSPEFAKSLRDITGEDVFVDPAFHGGGLHQGGEGSFLDMHTDFNSHPLHATWFRNLNILLYLNEGWRQGEGGELKLRHRQTGAAASVEPIFNRAVIMHTRDYTLHGYDPIKFPAGKYRRSVAAYAYTHMEKSAEHVSTTWYPDEGGIAKRMLGRVWPRLVRIKGKLLGSGTARNR